MQRKLKRPDDDKVTEAGIESFPASDPPAHNMPGRSSDGGAARRRLQPPTPARRLGSIVIAVVAVGLSILVIWLLFR